MSSRYTDQRERRGEPVRRGRRVWRLQRIVPTAAKTGSESSSQPRTEARPSLRGVDFFALLVLVALDRISGLTLRTDGFSCQRPPEDMCPKGYSRSARAAEEGVALGQEVAIGLEMIGARHESSRSGVTPMR